MLYGFGAHDLDERRDFPIRHTLLVVGRTGHGTVPLGIVRLHRHQSSMETATRRLQSPSPDMHVDMEVEICAEVFASVEVEPQEEG